MPCYARMRKHQKKLRAVISARKSYPLDIIASLSTNSWGKCQYIPYISSPTYLSHIRLTDISHSPSTAQLISHINQVSINKSLTKSTITSSLFHPHLKNLHFSQNPSHHDLSLSRDWLHRLLAIYRLFWAHPIFVFSFFFPLLFFCFWFHAVD